MTKLKHLKGIVEMEWVLALIIAVLCGVIYSLLSNGKVIMDRLDELEGDIRVYEHVLRERGIEITVGLSTSPISKE